MIELRARRPRHHRATREASPLEIRLLGELQVVRDGVAVALPASRKTRALLAYLVATGRDHHRDRLCELLWESPHDPRASLRWSLVMIRRVLDDPAATRLGAAHERVGFDAAGATVDLEIARGTANAPDADTAALERAAALFRGELLEGQDGLDCPRYQAWYLAERDAARSLRARILARLIERHAGAPEEALRRAREWVAADPLDEAAHLHVVRLLGSLRRTREALHQYETCARQLGGRPSFALEAARHALITAAAS